MRTGCAGLAPCDAFAGAVSAPTRRAMASSNGSAIATPAPRSIVRREMFQDLSVIALFYRLVRRLVAAMPERVALHHACHQHHRSIIFFRHRHSDFLNGWLVV